jgi:hypothetical protein
MKGFLWFTIALLCLSTIGESHPVIDLGKVEIQGKLNGPEVELIDSNLLGAQAARRLLRWQLKAIEAELLKSEAPATRGFTKGAQR